SVRDSSFFFFQAEDGIRDRNVTGVQTCALPISLDSDVLQESVRVISQAEILIIGGTSLSVYPAASLIDYFRGDHLVVINRDPTQIGRASCRERVRLRAYTCVVKREERDKRHKSI